MNKALHTEITRLVRLSWLVAPGIALLFLGACFSDAPKAIEESAQEIDRLLMCPVCPAETIAEAQVPVARDMRAFVREKLAEGWSRQQILDYFSSPDRYGKSVLAEPSKSGSGLIVWIIPPLAISGASVLAFFVLRAMKRRKYADTVTSNMKGNLAPYLSAIDEAIRARHPSKTYNSRVISQDGGPEKPTGEQNHRHG